MNLYELASRVIEALEAESIPYMVVGALSSSVFGIPRATKDVDIVLQLLTRDPLHRLETRLAEVVAFDPQVTFETLTGSVRHILTAKTRPPFIVELFELGSDPFVVERFSRRRAAWSAQLKRQVFLPTAEDVIVQKLRWGRPKDLDDARDVLAVQTPARLGMDYITRWCEIHQTSGHLHAMLAEIEPLL
ncbi:MAG: hypothetical protein WCP45_11070 [Verrucomicrobiota bacterium]